MPHAILPANTPSSLLLTKSYSREQAAQVAAELQAAQRSYGVSFTVGSKTAHSSITVFDGGPLPEPLGRNSIGELTSFEKWIESVALYYEEGLSDEAKEGFRKYFLQGLMPAQALQQDRLDDGV